MLTQASCYKEHDLLIYTEEEKINGFDKCTLQMCYLGCMCYLSFSLGNQVKPFPPSLAKHPIPYPILCIQPLSNTVSDISKKMPIFTDIRYIAKPIPAGISGSVVVLSNPS